jgi:hypothetical protein
MNEIEQYVNQFTEKAKKYLVSEYHLESFAISDFQAINFYLIDKALNSNRSVFIQSFDKDLPSLSQFPTVLSVAISLFFKNYCDDKTSYKVGEILQKDGIRYEIKQITESGYVLWSNFGGGQRLPDVKHKSIKKFIITNADLSNRRVKTKFDDYKKLFKLIFNTEYVPSKFNYKAAIILEKKEFDDELKNQVYTDIDILKAIPIRWISKNGTESWNHIPIAPMIFCVPDYETLQEYVLDKGEKIEALIIIGKNKYKEDVLTRIKRDLREGVIPLTIILGNDSISDASGQFIKWKWTYNEYSILNNYHKSEIKPILVEGTAFENAIAVFGNYLSELEFQYSINLRNVKSLRKFLYPLTLSKIENSRNINQVEYVNHLIKKVAADFIIENLDNQNIDPIQYLEQVEELITTIFEHFDNAKLKWIGKIENAEILLVPDHLLMNWKEEFKSKIKILSLKEFLKQKENYTTVKKVLLLSLFGNGVQPNQLIELLHNSQHTYFILAYKEEQEIIEEIKNRLFNETIAEYTSQDRCVLSGIEYEMKTKEVKVLDIIEDLHGKSLSDKREYRYEELEAINKCLTFEQSQEVIICDASKSVLFHNGSEWTKTFVGNLRPNDRVRIYNNLSKERLFGIAATEDGQGRFNKVDSDSKLWKTSLYRFFRKIVTLNPSFDEKEFLAVLRRSGLTISNPLTIRKWLNIEDKERFPNSMKNLIAIKQTINDDELNIHFESIKQSKRFYRGIMISLGRDLSDDVMDYIISDGKHVGKMLSNFTSEEIKTFVQSAAPERIIKTISITEDDESN